MITQQKLLQKNLSLLELWDYLQNVSEAYRIHGCSHSYEMEALWEA